MLAVPFDVNGKPLIQWEMEEKTNRSFDENPPNPGGRLGRKAEDV